MMAEHAYNLYCKDAKIIDFQKISFPICDGNNCYKDPIVDELKGEINNSSSIIIASPIYNYDLNAVAKNLIELTGKAWENKLVGFISAAGGKGSYMSPMSFANSLMLDFRCIIIPRFVYADKACFNKGDINDDIKDRIEELVDASILLSKALKK
jgi:FMN reductase